VCVVVTTLLVLLHLWGQCMSLGMGRKLRLHVLLLLLHMVALVVVVVAVMLLLLLLLVVMRLLLLLLLVVVLVMSLLWRWVGLLRGRGGGRAHICHGGSSGGGCGCSLT
jgi:hypothetical protein